MNQYEVKTPAKCVSWERSFQQPRKNLMTSHKAQQKPDPIASLQLARE